MSNRSLTLFAAFLLTLARAAQAQALPARTFVSHAGDDANNCLVAAPCRTFAATATKTDPGGEITALDSGVFGTISINKALTINAAPGSHAVSGHIEINAGETDVVVLRNLYVSGMGQARGILFNSGGTLHVESCVVAGFTNSGIHFDHGTANVSTNAFPELFVKDTITRNNGVGIFVANAVVSIDHCRFDDNNTGVGVDFQSVVTIANSFLSGNADSGLATLNPLSFTRVQNCVVTNNGTGIRASAINAGQIELKSRVYVSNTIIAGHAHNGIAPNGGEIISFGNNQLVDNNPNGAFSSTLPQQ